jgi:hypothetical protein
MLMLLTERERQNKGRGGLFDIDPFRNHLNQLDFSNKTQKVTTLTEQHSSKSANQQQQQQQQQQYQQVSSSVPSTATLSLLNSYNNNNNDEALPHKHQY